jgi:hypothetical protein
MQPEPRRSDAGLQRRGRVTNIAVIGISYYANSNLTDLADDSMVSALSPGLKPRKGGSLQIGEE